MAEVVAPRRRRWPSGLDVALCLILAGRTASAWAKGASEQTAAAVVTPIDITSSTCGSLVELNEQVRRRSPRIHLASAARSGASIKAEMRDLGTGGTEVVLTVPKTAGQPFSRQIRAQNCEEALEGLALLIVMALDPTAILGEQAPARTASPVSGGPAGGVSRSPKRKVPSRNAVRSTDGSERGVEPPSEPPESGTPPDTRAPESEEPAIEKTIGSVPRRAEAAEGGIEARSTAQPVADPARSGPTRTIFAAGANGIGMIGPAPKVMAGAALSLVWGWDRDSRWSPAIVLVVGHLERNGLTFPGGRADFALDAVQLEVCPLWFGMGRQWRARSCALAMLGALTAKGAQTLTPASHHRLLTVVGGSVALTYQAAWRVEILASVGVGSPLQRYSFQFEPAVFHQVAPIAVMGGLGAGVRFP